MPRAPGAFNSCAQEIKQACYYLFGVGIGFRVFRGAVPGRRARCVLGLGLQLPSCAEIRPRCPTAHGSGADFGAPRGQRRLFPVLRSRTGCRRGAGAERCSPGPCAPLIPCSPPFPHPFVPLPSQSPERSPRDAAV